VLVETRPDRGLLGGMAGPPGTDWTEAGPDSAAVAAAEPLRARFRAVQATVRHVFTHFALDLEVRVARVSQDVRPMRGRFVPAAEARKAAPTALRKALDLGLAALRREG
jgi:A/G-specific adenine glycosylase